MEVILFLLGGLAAVILGMFGFLYLASLKGTVRLDLPIKEYNPGDTIKGSFELQTKKAVEGNKLTASLIGVLYTSDRTRDGRITVGHIESVGHKGVRHKGAGHKEVFREEVLIEEARQYPVRHWQMYEFEINTPNPDTPEFKDSKLGKELATLAEPVFQHIRVRMKWQVEIRLDAKGIDIVGQDEIKINQLPDSTKA